MKYNNDDVRRRDRLLSEQRATELIRIAEYGVLSMIDEDGQPYAIPVNHVWDGEDSLYIHCAPEGKKLRAIAKEPQSMSLYRGRRKFATLEVYHRVRKRCNTRPCPNWFR